MTITVLTPTIGTPHLERAVRSVQAQTVPVRHLVVSDGAKYKSDVTKYAMRGWIDGNPPPVIASLQDNTGQPDWYGHRIYANYSQLIDTDYLFLLDEDNEYTPDHVETMLEKAMRYGYAWSYRQIQCADFSGIDYWESMGADKGHPSVPYSLVDTSSWCFSRRRIPLLRHIEHRWGADRNLTEGVIANEPTFHYACTKKHTLIYHAPEKYSKFYNIICNPCLP
jgi:glycosyltransferase involved in cell wall biosynthesis